MIDIEEEAGLSQHQVSVRREAVHISKSRVDTRGEPVEPEGSSQPPHAKRWWIGGNGHPPPHWHHDAR
jgi:hypothetical protein